jgi:hypothetical protein
MTGVQALERAAPTLPVRPGRVERREVAYVRHGTRSFMMNWDVAAGTVVTPSCGPTRTDADFLAHIARTVASDPTAPEGHRVTDTLNTHLSESLVRSVARVSGVAADLGVKDRRGILQSVARRAAVLSDPAHVIVSSSSPTRPSTPPG